MRLLGSTRLVPPRTMRLVSVSRLVNNLRSGDLRLRPGLSPCRVLIRLGNVVKALVVMVGSLIMATIVLIA